MDPRTVPFVATPGEIPVDRKYEGTSNLWSGKRVQCGSFLKQESTMKESTVLEL